MKFRFTKKEVRDIVISVLVLGLMFSFRDINFFIPLTIIVGIAFIVHELSHKFLAVRYDCKAEYVLWPQGVMFSLLVTFITGGRFLFAAIGFVSISTFYATRLGFQYINLSVDEIGTISAAGPFSNIIIALIASAISPFVPFADYAVTLNLILAIFNLLPVPPLDGSKVFMWSRLAWFALISLAGSLLFLIPLMGTLMSVLIALSLLGLVFILFQRSGL